MAAADLGDEGRTPGALDVFFTARDRYRIQLRAAEVAEALAPAASPTEEELAAALEQPAGWGTSIAARTRARSRPSPSSTGGGSSTSSPPPGPFGTGG